MGLESVEMVMEVEEAFDIEIADADAEKLRTPRDLIDLVMGKVGRTDVAVCLTQRAFHRLRKAFLGELRLKRADFQLDTRMDELLPLPARKTMLPAIYQLAGVAVPPQLERTQQLCVFLLLASVASGAAAGFALARASHGKSLLLNLAGQLSWLTGMAVAIGVLRFGFLLTNQMRTAFPKDLTTVKGHVRWFVAHNGQLLGTPPGQWSREQVAARVREIVVIHLGDKHYREDARFVQDMGMN
jgi:hypothetical protein